MAGQIVIRRILYPTDFSEISRVAFKAATALAGWYDSEIEALYVIPLMIVPAAVEAPYFPVIEVPNEARKEEILRDLGKLVEPARARGVKVPIRLVSGLPEDVILASAAAADLIVMGTHGWGGFERLVLGSTTEKVLAQAPCSVLTVCPASADSTMPRVPPFKRILCGLDLGSSSNATLDYALSLAQEAQGHLMLVTVVEDLPEAEVPHMPFDVPEYRRYRIAEARDALRRVVPGEARNRCQIEEHVGAGKPYREILRCAREWGAELIVVGAHGSAGVFPLGSTTRHVIREASCPVLAVRTNQPG